MERKTQIDLALLEGDAPPIDSVRRMAASSLGDAGLKIGEVVSAAPRRELWQEVLGRFARGGPGTCLLTVGGAGPTEPDWIPDLTAAVISRPIPGIPEALRQEGEPLTPLHPLFRGAAGLTIAGGLVVNLPGEEPWLSACLRSLSGLLGHALDKAAGDTGDCGRGPNR